MLGSAALEDSYVTLVRWIQIPWDGWWQSKVTCRGKPGEISSTSQAPNDKFSPVPHQSLPFAFPPQWEISSLTQGWSFPFCFGFHSFLFTNYLLSQVFFLHWIFPFGIETCSRLSCVQNKSPPSYLYSLAAICFSQAQPDLLKQYFNISLLSPFCHYPVFADSSSGSLPDPSTDPALPKRTNVLFGAISNGLLWVLAQFDFSVTSDVLTNSSSLKLPQPSSESHSSLLSKASSFHPVLQAPLCVLISLVFSHFPFSSYTLHLGASATSVTSSTVHLPVIPRSLPPAHRRELLSPGSYITAYWICYKQLNINKSKINHHYPTSLPLKWLFLRNTTC